MWQKEESDNIMNMSNGLMMRGMRNKIILGLLIIGLAALSFDFGRSWELSKTAEYCSSIGKKLSDSGPAYCVEK
ncbi:TPA: hypothetical protein H1O46_002026 [Salmonella enterica]|nr:hypothetical protein [Salmonella enterica]HAK6562374.1 hypothetical protein [Salmonella enterica]